MDRANDRKDLQGLTRGDRSWRNGSARWHCSSSQLLSIVLGSWRHQRVLTSPPTASNKQHEVPLAVSVGENFGSCVQGPHPPMAQPTNSTWPSSGDMHEETRQNVGSKKGSHSQPPGVQLWNSIPAPQQRTTRFCPHGLLMSSACTAQTKHGIGVTSAEQVSAKPSHLTSSLERNTDKFVSRNKESES